MVEAETKWTTKSQQAAPHPVAPGMDASKCPVNHTTYQNIFPTSPTNPSSSPTSCDSNAINERNQMPTEPMQSRSPDQRLPLNTNREISSIPMAGDGENKHWIYPSEQMFFNAMRRKNWNPHEEDMAVVVPIHNLVNEMAWLKILEWEKMHQSICRQPRLVRFQGRPQAFTPKARVKSWLGYTLPFDRHDWTVDRCGQQVTYIIDFYTGKADSRMPGAPSFYLDVRPKVESIGSVWDRIKMSWQKGEIL